MKKSDGFTITELMIALAIAGVLTAMALPSFNKMIMNNRLSTQANEVVTALHFARSEAVKRGDDVVLCRSSNGTSCAGSGGWEQGWLAYVDLDDNGALDAGELLRVFEALKGNNTLTPNGNYVDKLTYESNGYVTQSGRFVLCDDRNKDGDTADAEDFAAGRQIVISATGRVRTSATDDPSLTPFTNCVTP